MSLSNYSLPNGSLDLPSVRASSLTSSGNAEVNGNMIIDGTLGCDGAVLMNTGLEVAGAVDCEQIAFGAFSKILSGNGVPGAGVGADGDLFIRKDGANAGEVLYVKSAGAWAAIVSA
jgi:hypothetical protein